jgi:hypothetical protein
MLRQEPALIIGGAIYSDGGKDRGDSHDGRHSGRRAEAASSAATAGTSASAGANATCTNTVDGTNLAPLYEIASSDSIVWYSIV